MLLWFRRYNSAKIGGGQKMNKFKNPSITVDIVVERENKIALIERGHVPYKGDWAIPGGFIEYGKETLEQAAARELYEETHLRVEPYDLKLFWVSSDPHRDPRGHIISCFYIAKIFRGELCAGDDAKKAKWFQLDDLPKLAFDHEEAINNYLKMGK